MRKSLRSTVVAGAIYLVFGVFLIYIRHDDLVLTDVSTWKSSTWLGAALLLFGFSSVLWGVYRFRSRTPLTDEDVQSTIARVQIWGGEYLITEDAVYPRFDERWSLKTLHRQKPLWAGLTLVSIVGALLGAIGMVASGLLVQLLPFRLFLPSLYVFLGSVLLGGSVAGGSVVWHWISLRRRLSAELGTRTRSNEDAISVDAIDAVVFDRHLDLPAMYIKHHGASGSAVQVAYLLRGAEDARADAESAFQSLDVPIHRITDQNQTSSAD